MNNINALKIFIGIGGLFGFLASLMAYLISYNEWIHHYPTKKEPRKIALRTAIFTFVVFFSHVAYGGLFPVEL